jgi:tripartite ATP-independent transporter DctM subunit
MTWYAASLLLFGCLAAAFATGMPAAFSFFAINVVGAYQYLGGDAGLGQLVRNGVASITNFSLTPIPFFILMGEVLFHTGVAMNAIDAIERLIRRVPGRLAVVAVVAGTVFSAISGSTIATTAMLGSLMLPEMLRRGYHPNMAMGPIMAIGGVDMLIPPSALTVLLGSLAGISISHLLVAGILPGLLLAAIFVVYIIARAKANPALAPAFEEEEKDASGWERWRPLVVYVVPLTLIFGVVIGAMSAGWATPTESAALGATATVAVAALYRSLRLSSLMKALLGTAAISGVILFIIVGATTFAQILAFSGATNGLVAAVRDASFGPVGVLVGMMLILLALGCFIDQVSMMLLTLPFFMPLVQHYGYDPIWFGVLYLIAMQLGLLTPPFGLLLFTMKSVAPKHITMGQVYRAASPYVVFGLLMLVIVMLSPPLATWLPRALLGK